MLSTDLKRALVTQVACGDPELKALLEDEIDFILMCLERDISCLPRVEYMQAQLALIELAQIFSRHQIDTTTRTFNSQVRETYTARARRNMDSESTANGRTCQWSAATSQQRYVRTSTDDSVAFSESNSLHTSERLEDGFDRSRRGTSGTGFSYQRVIHTVEHDWGNSVSPGAGQERRNSQRRSETSGGTNPLVPVAGTNWEPVFFQPSLTPPFITTTGPTNTISITPATSADLLCPYVRPGEPNPVYCTGFGYPSVGQGWHGNFELGISLPGPVAVTVKWAEGFNQRQYYHCSASTVDGFTTSFARMDSLGVTRTTARPEDNRSGSNESSYVIHYVRRVGSSTRRGTDSTDAEERQRGRADGTSHAESERNTKGNAFAQRRSESLTTGDSATHLRRNQLLTDDRVSNKYGQISVQLGRLWDRVWKQLQTLEREYSAIPMASSFTEGCCTAVGCNSCLYHRRPPRHDSFLPTYYHERFT